MPPCAPPTNVLVRYLTQDDAAQAALATRLIESLTSDAPGFVSHVVLVEVAWVLESCYALGGAALGEVLETVLRTDALRIERAEVAWRALRRFRQEGCDFSDALVTELALTAGCDAIYSFDNSAAKRSGMTLLE